MTSPPAPVQPNEATVYLAHVLGVLMPGRKVPAFVVHTVEPVSTTNWEVVDHQLLVEEGRRQLDRQIGDLAEIRGRAQFVVTSGLALVALIFAGVRIIANARGPAAFILWCAAIVLALLGILGASAVIVARKEIGAIDAALMTYQTPPVLPGLAAAYARTIRAGEDTIATQITVYRDAVLMVLAAVVTYGLAWAVAVL
jgi:hypothetical protein